MTSASRKQIQTYIDVDAYLRSKSQGARFRVTAADVATELNISPSIVATALTYLSRLPGSGLTRVKGGQLEFMMPEAYPNALQAFKDSLHPEDRRPRARRGNLTSEVVAELYKNYRSKLVTIQQLTDGLDAHPTSVGTILHRLCNEGILQDRSELGRGTFYFEPDDERQPSARAIMDLSPGAFRQPKTVPGIPMVVGPGEAKPVPITDERIVFGPGKPGDVALKVTPSPADVAARVERKPPKDKLYEEVGRTTEGRAVVRNLETGKMGVVMDL